MTREELARELYTMSCKYSGDAEEKWKTLDDELKSFIFLIAAYVEKQIVLARIDELHNYFYQTVDKRFTAKERLEKLEHQLTKIERDK